MTEIREDLRPGTSDIFRRIDDFDDGSNIMWDLKIILIFYFQSPINAKLIPALYDTYMKRYGERIGRYRSTSPGANIKKFDAAADAELRRDLLPKIYKSIHWGYAFDDATREQSFRFMFHGYKQKSQQGISSFCRFEFPYNFSTEDIKALALDVAQILPYTSATCGFALQVDAREPEANDHMYAVCQRFWGVEAWSQDITVQYLGNRFKCINWLTFLGNSIVEELPGVIEAASPVAFEHIKLGTGHMFQTRAEPVLIDRNRAERYQPETRLALDLAPAQTDDHDAFLGPRWTVDNTMEWLRRFTEHPDL